MPMVPTFQGGLPREVASGNSGRGIVNVPRPTMDYGRVLQRALEPLNQTATTVSKALEIEANRNVKAESDEAETRFMDAVNNRLYNPDSGYFNNQGKSAVDLYDATMQGLQKDADDIVGSLSPWAQEAIRTRIGERLRSAQLKTTQWNNSQRNVWHIGSSKARIDKLVESAGQNYGDADYLGSTLASLDQEVDYLANLQGFGAEQRAALKQGYYDMAVAQRYSSWSNDDPVGAMADFQVNRDSLSNDVRERIGGDLWRQSKPELAAMVADMIGPTMLDKRDFVREMMAGKRFGVPVVDNLTRAQKIDLYSAAYSYAAQQRSNNRAELRRAEENSLALAATEGFDPNPLAKESFVAAYGEKEGAARFDDYSDNLRTREEVYRFGGLTNGEIVASVESLRPFRGSENYATEAKNYELAQKAARTVIKSRREDPIASAFEDSKYGISEITDWGANDVAVKLQARLPVYDQIAGDYQTPKTLLSKGEAESLTEHFNSLEPNEQVKFLATVAGPLSGSGVLSVLGTQIKPKDSRIGTALFVADGNLENGAKYLRGRQYVDEKRVALPTKGEGSQEDFGRILGDEEGTVGITNSSAVRSTMVDAAQGLWAYEQIVGEGATSEDVVTAAFGEIADYNGKKIFLPKRPSGAAYTTGTVSGWFSRDFFDLVDDKIKRMEKDKTVLKTMYGEVEARDFAPKIRGMQLESVDDGLYRIIDPELGYVRNADDTPYVLDLNPVQVNSK